ncbi:3-hydroxyisobutyrate dehydrogenase-like beta-hydroxyacid dehydrogenase [Kribbella amoyensis]|uniref:3-hydroxyisobutyrate dehydrogenase-like beta-hydroxyacid dehydrogenase n=1 Tax=Kribbella amoyensis TaxID=996641 RepID=A0A561BML3_9ACTN|nr:NAD(P)-binding domain-containing protein [Kribbella amoyensis]TWD80130.1 3-hydroxyisobutyrate dehydrogenase-like beta-hydroxyacid dehydrogenase [Kribbella amoyensis]
MSQRVAVLGAGSLGAVIARAFAAAGHPTTVWNRTPDRLSALVADTPALRPALSVPEAIADADLITLVVADAAAARAVLDSAGDAIAGKIVVNFTSTTPEQTQVLAGRVGAGYLDGAAMSGTRLVGDPTGLFLYAGDATTFADAEPTLRALGIARAVGTDPGDASLWDTALLGLNLGVLGAFYQAVALIGGSAEKVAAISAEYLPFATGLLADHARQIDAKQYPDDDGSLAVYAAAVDHLIATAADRGVGTDVAVPVRSVINRAIEAGHGDDGLASVTEVLR